MSKAKQETTHQEMDSDSVPETTPSVFELSKPGRRSFCLPKLDVSETANPIPDKFLRKKAASLPEVSNLQIARHFTRLSQKNMGIDSHFYPLGSCTMKYNPKINDKVAAFPGFARIHPYQEEQTIQGVLEVLHSLQHYLREMSGLKAVSLMPAAGAHGELSSLMAIRSYHDHHGRKPSIVLVTDSAHGTNPASCTLCGYKVKTVKSNAQGNMDMDDLQANLSEDVAALMITNPNTLGLFEQNIAKITEMLHNVGALVYMDGANMNALLGITRPGDFGIDVMHYNLHKTFSTPHGGGGPGAGPIAVGEKLADFLPGLIVEKKESLYTLIKPSLSIGRTRGFVASSGVVIRAYAYIRAMGREGLENITQMAVLNANYLMHHLKQIFHLPYQRTCMHEFVLSAVEQKKQDVRALDIAKRLLDMGFHPPTIYFPLIVPEALMIEPTETESKETLDAFIQAMKNIDQETIEEPWKLQEAPFTMPVTRLDEVTAARKPVVRWQKTS